MGLGLAGFAGWRKGRPVSTQGARSLLFLLCAFCASEEPNATTRVSAMNQFSGLLITALSVLAAAIVSGLRLKPYIDAGAARTPASFMLYPVLVTLAITVPVVFLLRKIQGKKDIDIGPVRFNDRMSFIALGCIVYSLISLTFFYDRAPVVRPAPQRFQPAEPRPAEPLNIVFPAAR